MNQLNVQDAKLKSVLDALTIEDFKNLRTVKEDKTVAVHLERIKAGRFEKREINALTKLLCVRFSTPERQASVKALIELSMDYYDNVHLFSTIYGDIMYFKRGGMKISKEQTDFGKTWLKDYFFKKNGEPRSGKRTEYVGDRVLKIAKNVSRFEFVGVIIGMNQWGTVNNVQPVYRTYNRKGEYFDYSPIHWGEPIIVEGA